MRAGLSMDEMPSLQQFRPIFFLWLLLTIAATVLLASQIFPDHIVWMGFSSGVVVMMLYQSLPYISRFKVIALIAVMAIVLFTFGKISYFADGSINPMVCIATFIAFYIIYLISMIYATK
jgi:hypothetical protein